MRGSYLTEEKVKEILFASKDKTNNEHNVSSDDDEKYDEVLHDLIIISLSSDEKNEDDDITNDFGVKLRDNSECWSNVPAASNPGRITAKNNVREKLGPKRFALSMCSSITECFPFFFRTSLLEEI